MPFFAFVDMDEFTQIVQCHITTEAFFVGICVTSGWFFGCDAAIHELINVKLLPCAV